MKYTKYYRLWLLATILWKYSYAKYVKVQQSVALKSEFLDGTL